MKKINLEDIVSGGVYKVKWKKKPIIRTSWYKYTDIILVHNVTNGSIVFEILETSQKDFRQYGLRYGGSIEDFKSVNILNDKEKALVIL